MKRRISLFYFLNFATIGAFFPWFPPYLAQHGYSAGMIGMALALPSVARMTMTPFWGLAADRLRAPRGIMAAAAVLGGVVLLATGFPLPQAGMFGLLLMFGFFNVPIFPLAEAFTLGALGARRAEYGRIRLWGSLGFIATSLGLGLIVRRFGMDLVPWFCGLPMVLSGLVAWGFPREAGPVPQNPAPGPAAGAWPWKPLLLLFAAAALGQGSHGPYYGFFTLQLTQKGVAAWLAGLLWAWAVLAEVGLMAVSGTVLKRLGLAGAVRWSLALTAGRWFLYALGPPLPWIVAGQALHAFSFALLHVASVQLTDRLTPEGWKSLGQSLLSTTAYGIGGGVGMFLAGQFAGKLGDPGLYAGAGLAALAGLLISLGLGGLEYRRRG